MLLDRMNDQNQYFLSGLSFSQVKTIKDACRAYAKQGSAVAEKLAAELEGLMDKIQV